MNTSTLVFEGVTVLPMVGEEALPDRDVVVRDGIIVAIGAAGETSIPRGAVVIPARGKCLMPGLIDMHVHLSDARDPQKLLSYGVTSVRNMADVPWWAKVFPGFPDPLKLKRSVEEGEIPGPTIVTCGITLDGADRVSPFNLRIESPDEARKEVAAQAEAGYDLIKVYDRLGEEEFRAAVEEAATRGRPVVGHVPFAVGLEGVVGSGLRSIEHLTGFIDHNRAKLLVDEGELERWARRVKAAGMAVCPTLSVWRNIPPKGGFNRLRAQPEFASLSWRIKWLWKTTLGYVEKKPYEGDDFPGDMARVTSMVTGRLNAAGVTIVAGTDMNFLGVYPGSSLHRELEYLAQAGLTNIEALRAATVNAAKALGREGDLGSVAVGKRADLLLLGKNPLEDIRNTRSIEGVCAGGKWIGGGELAKLRG